MEVTGMLRGRGVAVGRVYVSKTRRENDTTR
jgi:phosphohistidine phosphatase SixA